MKNHNKRGQRHLYKVSHHVQARLARHLCSNATFLVFWWPSVHTNFDDYCTRYVPKLPCGRVMSLIQKVAGYEAPFPFYAMVCMTMHDRSCNANIWQLCLATIFLTIKSLYWTVQRGGSVSWGFWRSEIWGGNWNPLTNYYEEIHMYILKEVTFSTSTHAVKW